YPSEVFDEVISTRPNLLNWLVPTLLACVTGLVLLGIVSSQEQTASAIAKFADRDVLSAFQVQRLASGWRITSEIAVCLGTVAGTLWSSFVLWFMGRFFLKCRFSFLKTLEVVGLTGMILVLSGIVTALLVGALGDAAARPALSLVIMKSEAGNR